MVALVEQDDADAHLRELLHARAGGLAEQVPELHAGVLAARDLALERGADAGELAGAAVGGLALERLAFAQRLLRRHAGGGGALVRPARLREPAEQDLRVLELAQRLVGQAGDRLERVRARDLVRAVGERAHRPRPLLLDALVGREHERALADPPDQLHAEQRLARCRAARRCACACCRSSGPSRTRPARRADTAATPRRTAAR